MENNHDNSSQVRNEQEIKVEDLPIEDPEQDTVKGGGRVPGKVNINT